MVHYGLAVYNDFDDRSQIQLRCVDILYLTLGEDRMQK